MLALFLLAGCSVPEYGIVPDEGGPAFPGREELLASLPLRLITGNSDAAESSMELQALSRITFKEVPPFGEIEADEIVVFRDILLPVVDLHDPGGSLSSGPFMDHYRNGTALPGNITIISLGESALPLRGVPLDGMYFDDPEYPLIRRIVIRLDEIPLGEPESVTEKIAAGLSRSKREEELRLRREKLSDWLEALRASAEAMESEELEIAWIASVGDMMPGRGVSSLLEQKDGVSKVLGSLLPLLRSNHIMAGNFEGTLSRGRKATPKSYNFSFPVSVLPRLHEAGFDYLSLTNNHIWDFGEGGFLDTLAALEGSALVTSGAGRDVKEASKPWISQAGTEQVAVLSVGAYPTELNGFDGRTEAAAEKDKPGILFTGKGARKAVSEAFSGDTFNILYVHGGHEWQRKPAPEYEALYRSFVDLGADLVIGSHPHVLQRMEAYKGSLIAYSLGNFIFPGMEEMAWAEDSLVLRTGIFAGKIVYAEAIPAVISGRTVKLDADPDALHRFLKLP
jgi:poly-gamma-glutamate synthesis protein (capsule biosynthesis protein)